MSLKVQKTEDLPERKKAKRYDDGTRLKLLNDYQERRNAGENAMVAAKSTGVPYITLRTWQKNIEAQRVAVGAKVRKPRKGKIKTARKATKKKKSRKPRKQPRKTMQNRAPKTAVRAMFVLEFPDGVRVECPNAESAIKFLKKHC